MIEIIEYKPLHKGSLLAIVSIKIPKWGGFIVKKIKVFSKGDARWIAFPSEDYIKDGQKKYFYLNVFETSEMMEFFRKSFFESFENFQKIYDPSKPYRKQTVHQSQLFGKD